MTTINHSLARLRLEHRRVLSPSIRRPLLTVFERSERGPFASPSEQVLRGLPHIHSLQR